MRIALLSALVLGFACNSDGGEKSPNAIPILSLEKQKYGKGEAIRFWVGVEREGTETIPKEYWNTCVLHIKSPDGKEKHEPAGWPIDGAVDLGWRGGCGLGKDIQAGIYTLVFEFAKRKTKPVKLEVCDLDIIKKIKAEFVFRKTGDVAADTRIPVELRIRNTSNHTIQFPKRGNHEAYVWVHVHREEPPRVSQFFYPSEKLLTERPGVIFDTYTWNAREKVSSVVLNPGETFEQVLLLADCYEFWGAGDYLVVFGTTLQILVGNKSGEFAEFCPIRIPVSGSAKFRVK